MFKNHTRQTCISFLSIYLAFSLPLVANLSQAITSLDTLVLEQRPHDTTIFTQGLHWRAGKLFESSGLYQKSFVRHYDADNGTLGKNRSLSPTLFAEGLTIFNNQLFLLTWRAGLALVMNPDTLETNKHIRFSGQGWGLTNNGKQLIMSDGTEKIYFRNADTFKIERTIEVHNKWRKYTNINELEYAHWSIWANVWQSPYILKISPKDGSVLGVANLQHLVDQNSTVKGHTVLNGIAYDSEHEAFWITGKLWPRRYLVRFRERIVKP